MILEDLLNPLEAEQIKALLDPKDVEMKGLTSSFFKISIPLEPTSSKTQVKALKFIPQSSPKRILIGLFWGMMFGKKFKVYHWFVLFNVLVRTIRKGEQSRNLLKLLVISTSSEGKAWNTSLKPIMTTLNQMYGRDKSKLMITGMLKDLPFEMPTKDPKLEELLKVEFGVIVQKKPKEPARIGVGYKDHGSLGKGSKIEPTDPEFFQERSEVFDYLLRQVKNEIPEFFKI